jgi:bifunctional non-homologous end joining protein LigD
VARLARLGSPDARDAGCGAARQPGLVYEPKYDGIRALVHLDPAGIVRIWSRLGNEKTSQFPALVTALRRSARRLKGPLFVDGEIVALDERGQTGGLPAIAGPDPPLERARRGPGGEGAACRVHRVRPAAGRRRGRSGPSLAGAPRAAREAPGPQTAGGRPPQRAGDGDGRALHDRALEEGWEGLIAKEAHAPYQSGRRSPAWRKIKVLHEQEFVIGGWTEPRQTRQYFGALLLGVHDDGALRYVGHTGTGFDQKELSRVSKLLRARRCRPRRSPSESDERAGALGASGSRRPGALHGVDGGRQAAPPGVPRPSR